MRNSHIGHTAIGIIERLMKRISSIFFNMRNVKKLCCWDFKSIDVILLGKQNANQPISCHCGISISNYSKSLKTFNSSSKNGAIQAFFKRQLNCRRNYLKIK